jgi:hypothetical protein
MSILVLQYFMVGYEIMVLDEVDHTSKIPMVAGHPVRRLKHEVLHIESECQVDHLVEYPPPLP